MINSNVAWAACDDGQDVCLETQTTTETSVVLLASDQRTEASSTSTQTGSNTLVDSITTDLKARRLTQPVGDNALEKILRLKDIAPDHDYAINGVRYVARIYLSMARADLRNNRPDRAQARLGSAFEVLPSLPGLHEFASQLATAQRASGPKKTDPASVARTGANVKPGVKSTADANGSVNLVASRGDSSVPTMEPTAGQDGAVITPIMVGLPAGSFVMGSESGENNEKPAHQMKVAAFSMSRFEITREQFHVFRTSAGRDTEAPELSQALLPISGVTSDEAIAYARWLSQKTGKLFRLPSEAEWEYAARAGTMTPYHSGSAIFGNANCLTCLDEIPRAPMPVGSFEPNAFGLYDMHGNVAEWTSSCMTQSYFQTNEKQEQICVQRAVRGGSWRSTREQVRSSYRVGQSVSGRTMDTGFRLVHDGL